MPARIPVRDISAPSPTQSLVRPLVVRPLGELTQGGALAEPAHRHDFHFAFFVARGRGTHRVEDRTYPVGPGSLFTMTPGQVHAHTLAAGAAGFLLAFTPVGYLPDAAARASFEAAFAPDHRRLSPAAVSQGTALLEGLTAELAREGPPDAVARRAWLDLLFALWARASAPGSAGPASSVLRDLRQLLDAHFAEQQSAAWFAARLGLSPEALAREVRTHLDTTVAALQRERLLLEARRLLRDTDLRVSEVAYQLGYADVSYFVRLFRKAVGSPPGAWRAARGGASVQESSD